MNPMLLTLTGEDFDMSGRKKKKARQPKKKRPSLLRKIARKVGKIAPKVFVPAMAVVAIKKQQKKAAAKKKAKQAAQTAKILQMRKLAAIRAAQANPANPAAQQELRIITVQAAAAQAQANTANAEEAQAEQEAPADESPADQQASEEAPTEEAASEEAPAEEATTEEEQADESTAGFYGAVTKRRAAVKKGALIPRPPAPLIIAPPAAGPAEWFKKNKIPALVLAAALAYGLFASKKKRARA